MEFHRNAEGVVVTEKGTFKVPKTESVLGIAHNNDVYDGDEFHDDSWVYRNGVRVRKWFIGFVDLCSTWADAKIWEPKLDDVAALETRRWHFHQNYQRRVVPLWDILYNKMKVAGEFGGLKLNRPTPQGYVRFGRYSPGSWDWCREGEKPDVINQELVNEWFDFEKFSSFMHKPFYLYTQAFTLAVDRCFGYKKFGKDYNKKLHLVVNGRDYWFARNLREFAERFFSKISFPEDTQNIVVKV